MADLAPASPFGAALPSVVGDAGRVRIELLPPYQALGLRIAALDDATARRVAEASGVALPLAPNTTTGARRRWLWLGPRDWLLMDEEPLDGIAERLATALAGVVHAVTPLGPSLAAIALSGPHARDVLAKGCPLDLHPSVFPSGACARSLYGKARILLHRRAERFELYVDVSIARHMAALLQDAAGEFLADAAPLTSPRLRGEVGGRAADAG